MFKDYNDDPGCCFAMIIVIFFATLLFYNSGDGPYKNICGDNYQLDIWPDGRANIKIVSDNLTQEKFEAILKRAMEVLKEQGGISPTLQATVEVKFAPIAEKPSTE